MSAELRSAAPAWVTVTSALVRRLPAGRYRVMNGLCSWKSTPAFLARMPRELGGAEFVCDLRDTISREVCYTGRYEAQETALLQSVLRPGMTFVDVGANWGYFTLIAAYLVGPSGRVVSLEPDPRIFARLHESVARNRLSQVTDLQIAAAGAPATLNLCGYDEQGDNFGLSRISEQTGGARFAVAARPLDDVFDELELGSLDLLKMDIEGYEGFALAGMQTALKKNRIKRMILELHPEQLAEHGQAAAELVEQMRGFGYRPYRIDHSLAAFRRAAYQRRLDPRDSLAPLEIGAELDEWPHLYWTAPGIEN